MVLVTLGGCHLLDSLVIMVSIKARKKLVRGYGEEFVRGVVLALRGSRRPTLVKVRREERQMVQPCQVLELVVSTPCGRV